MSVSFKIPEDIGNRAAQHVGASRFVSFQDTDSKSAAEIGFVYDKIREAELRTNVWRFATRRAILYPINTQAVGGPVSDTIIAGAVDSPNPTMLLVPAAWSATETYPFGSIVIDTNGDIWVSLTSMNVNNVPGAGPNWDSYFGSMCVEPYDTSGTTGYFAGDLVYNTDDDGETNVFVSMQTGNSIDPSVAIIWDNVTTFQAGQVVTDGSYFYRSVVDFNLGNQPGVYTGWLSTVTYSAGDLVAGTDGKVYQSIAGTNLNYNPVGDLGVHWTPTGNQRGVWPIWNTNTTYGLNDVIAGLDGNLYQSLKAGNLANNPIGATYNPNTPASNTWIQTQGRNPWTTAFKTSTASDQWLRLDATLANLNINYPIGAGPAFQSFSRNVFKLPNGYIRMAPQDPKAGTVSFMGAPSGPMFNDWVLEGDYLVSATPYPVMIRFVANVTDVTRMDNLFCEAVAATIGTVVAETLTQSGAKVNMIGGLQKGFVESAKRANGIEIGAVAQAVDDYISTRL